MVERGEVEIFNRVVGSATGYEQTDMVIFNYVGFKPLDGFDMPNNKNLIVDYLAGTFKNLILFE